MKAAETVKKTIISHALIKPGDIVILGLSGGPDSLSLLYILHGLQGEFGFTLKALHLNHLMRGEAAEEDVRFLTEQCALLGVELFVERCDVYGKAELEGTSPEEAGRKARHEALRAKAQQFGAKIAFAHNKNDQAETVLMRILRGTGVHGLAAMEYERADGVIRPLLDTPRAEIEKYCTENSLNPRFDCTNADDNYTRNKLRHLLIPQLEKEYNPSIRDGLVRLSASAREDDEALSAIASEVFDASVIENGTGRIVLDSRKLADQLPAVLKRVLCKAFLSIGLDQDIASVHLNSLCSVIYERRGGKIVQFPSGYYASMRGGKLEFSYTDEAFTKPRKC